MKFINWIKKQCKENDMEFIEFDTLTTTQYRVKKGNRFVDLWPNGSYRDLEGNFHRRGASNRGWGFSLMDDNSTAWEYGYIEGIKEEIKRLSK